MATTEKFFRPGDYVFHEGDASRSMYLVKKGTVAIRKRKGGTYIELAKVHSNEVLGELSFFDRRPRSAAAIALTEVEAVEIAFEGLDKLWAGVPDYMKTIMASVAERLRRANETIRQLQKETVDDTGESTSEGKEEDAASILAATTTIMPDGSQVAPPSGDAPAEDESGGGESEGGAGQ